MGPIPLRGNVAVLFPLFFGITTLLAGAMYQAYQLYSRSAGAIPYGVMVAATTVGFTFSLAIVARILYKVAA